MIGFGRYVAECLVVPRFFLLIAAALLVSLPAVAGEASVVGAKAEAVGNGTWRFYVTLRHDDEGWAHYADAWDILGPDGKVLATRTLLHPHETEQPFTRSLSNVKIPDSVTEVRIRAHDNIHGYGGATMTVSLPR